MINSGCIRSFCHILVSLYLGNAFNQSTQANRFGQLNHATCLNTDVRSNQVATLDASALLNQSTARNFNPTSNHSTRSNICLTPVQQPNPDRVNYQEMWRAGIAFESILYVIWL